MQLASPPAAFESRFVLYGPILWRAERKPLPRLFVVHIAGEWQSSLCVYGRWKKQRPARASGSNNQVVLTPFTAAR